LKAVSAATTDFQPAPSSLKLGEGFRERLRDLQGDRSVAAFAKFCDIPDSGMRGYLSGPGMPRLDNLVQIAEACGVSIAWLGVGAGPKDASALTKLGLPSLDVDLLKNVLIAVDGHLRDHNLVMKTDKKAALVALLYDHFAAKDGRVEVDAFRRFMDALS
jgi:hypothetical protein